MVEALNKLKMIQGAGSKKQKKQKPPYEAPNTLQSAAKGQILDLISYGPIKGLVNGLQSVFLDDTPVENPDGTLNHKGITVDMRHGEPDQTVLPGFKAISNPREINAEILEATPISRTLLNNEADAIIVTIRVSALILTNDKGDSLPSEVPFAVHIRNGAGVWNTGVADVIKGKTTSPYERSYRIDLQGSGPFTVKVLRGNKESETQMLRDQIFWSYLTEVIDVRQNYPGCAVVGVEVDAKLFGNSMPSRKYLMDLSIIKVPSNYNPETRAYTGLWDGTFKEAWTDNPAWAFYDLATHPIIGAGISSVNKWALYEIAKYCDELVDDGYGGQEPRFTCNTLLASQEDAITALNTMASIFRGMMYWGAGVVEPVADMPGPIRRVLKPADVIGGEFTYSGTSLQERHSVAVVMWNDPEDSYEAKPEMVEDADQIELLGWRELRITAVACTSRGQARRVGLWALYSEKEETQSVSFSVPAKQFDMRPGEFFSVADPYRAGSRLGGRITAIAGTTITLDANPIEAASGWTVTMETDTGGLVQSSIIRVEGHNLVLSSVPPSVFVGGGFSLSSSSVAPRIFRVVSVREEANSVFSITGTEHSPGKYDRVEKGLVNPDVPTSLVPTGRLSAPANLAAEPYTFVAGGTVHQGIAVSWTAPDDGRVERFILDVKGPDDVSFRTVYADNSISYDIVDAESGPWSFRVRATSVEWGNSAWTEISKEIASLLSPVPPDSLSFTSTTNSITILPKTDRFGIEFEFWRSEAAIPQTLIEDNATYLGTSQFFVDMPLPYGTTFFYYVRGVNIYGKSAWVAGNATTRADVDEILDIILQEEQDSPLGQWFKEEFDKISGVMEGSVNDRIGIVGGRLDQTISEIEDLEQTLSTELDAIQAQLEEFSLAPEWTDEFAYYEGDVVVFEDSLWRAETFVPADTPPPDEDYWKYVGDFTSLSGALADLALRVQEAETSVEIIDGLVTPVSRQLTSLQAMWREQGEDEDGYLEGALRQWDAKAEFIEEVQVRASENESLAQRVTNLNASLGDMDASITTLEQVVVNEREAVSTQLTQLKAQVDDDILASLQIESLARADDVSALASDILAMRSTVGEDIDAAIQSERLTSANENAALAADMTNLDTRMGNVEDDVHGQSEAISLLETSVSEQEGAITAQASSIDSLSSSIVDASQSASAAQQAAQDAVNLIDAKGEVIFGPTAPTVDQRRPDNLWIDTTAGKNTPKRWDGYNWVVVTDKTAVDAAAAAAAAYQLALTKADAAAFNSLSTSVSNLNGTVTAQAQSINSVTATVGQHTTQIQTTSSAISTAEGKMNALWGVKMQQLSDGKMVVAGLGLGMDNSSGTPYSHFQVRSDRFSIINGANGAEVVPFVVDGGNTIIRTALIQNAAIDTLKIRGNAVTVPKFTSAFSPVSSGTPLEVLFTTVDLDYAGWLYVHASGAATFPEPLEVEVTWQLLINGSLMYEAGSVDIPLFATGFALPVSAGSHRVSLTFKASNSTYRARYRSLFCMGVKR